MKAIRPTAVVLLAIIFADLKPLYSTDEKKEQIKGETKEM